MANVLVREDSEGVYINTGGYRFRPGNVGHYDAIFDMSDAGLKAGDRIKASHWAYSTLAKIHVNNKVYYWHADDRYKYGMKL